MLINSGTLRQMPLACTTTTYAISNTNTFPDQVNILCRELKRNFSQIYASALARNPHAQLQCFGIREFVFFVMYQVALVKRQRRDHLAF